MWLKFKLCITKVGHRPHTSTHNGTRRHPVEPENMIDNANHYYCWGAVTCWLGAAPCRLANREALKRKYTAV